MASELKPAGPRAEGKRLEYFDVSHSNFNGVRCPWPQNPTSGAPEPSRTQIPGSRIQIPSLGTQKQWKHDEDRLKELINFRRFGVGFR